MVQKVRRVFFGWWVISAAFCIFMMIGGITLYGFTAFFNPILNEMGWSRTQASLANSLRSIEGGLTQPFIGFFIDRFGARKCIFVGLLFVGTSLILMSRLSSLITFYLTFLLLSFGHGLGVGNAEYSAASNWFKRRRSLALGIVASGFGFSGLMTPVIITLISNYGWRNALLILGPATLAIGLPLSLLIRHKPEPYGLTPDGDTAPDPQSQSMSTSPAATAQTSTMAGPASEGLTVKECLATRTFWLLVLFSLFCGFAQSAMIIHIMPALISYGIPQGVAGWAVTGMTGFSLIGRLGLSYAGDKFDKRKVLAFAAAIEAIGILIFANISATWMIFPFLLFYGPGQGALIPLIPAIQADSFGMKSFATVRGLLFSGMLLPGVVAPIFAGWIYDTQGSYRLAFMLYAAICVLAVPTIFMINKHRKETATS
ncbi:MAG: MFS transporter [Chloroflexota bacterium]